MPGVRGKFHNLQKRRARGRARGHPAAVVALRRPRRSHRLQRDAPDETAVFLPRAVGVRGRVQGHGGVDARLGDGVRGEDQVLRHHPPVRVAVRPQDWVPVRGFGVFKPRAVSVPRHRRRRRRRGVVQRDAGGDGRGVPAGVFRAARAPQLAPDRRDRVAVPGPRRAVPQPHVRGDAAGVRAVRRWVEEHATGVAAGRRVERDGGVAAAGKPERGVHGEEEHRRRVRRVHRRLVRERDAGAVHRRDRGGGVGQRVPRDDADSLRVASRRRLAAAGAPGRAAARPRG
mmetsp:Transcript_14319/g.51531  ORF Transcript_14319/g.51531 Transcript_14319/m.51531 type:complete len:286 (-) Transcript_14319:916-1773(-)